MKVTPRGRYRAMPSMLIVAPAYIYIYKYVYVYMYIHMYKQHIYIYICIYIHMYIPKERAKLRMLVGTILDCSTHFMVTGRVAADDDVANAKL
jgi:hypothetical protein